MKRFTLILTTSILLAAPAVMASSVSFTEGVFNYTIDTSNFFIPTIAFDPTTITIDDEPGRLSYNSGLAGENVLFQLDVNTTTTVLSLGATPIEVAVNSGRGDFRALDAVLTNENITGTFTAIGDSDAISGTFTGSLRSIGAPSIDVTDFPNSAPLIGDFHITFDLMFAGTYNGIDLSQALRPSVNGFINSATGRVELVPVPGAVWLMLSGMAGLLGLKRRRA